MQSTPNTRSQRTATRSSTSRADSVSRPSKSSKISDSVSKSSKSNASQSKKRSYEDTASQADNAPQTDAGIENSVKKRKQVQIQSVSDSSKESQSSSSEQLIDESTTIKIDNTHSRRNRPTINVPPASLAPPSIIVPENERPMHLEERGVFSVVVTPEISKEESNARRNILVFEGRDDTATRTLFKGSSIPLRNFAILITLLSIALGGYFFSLPQQSRLSTDTSQIQHSLSLHQAIKLPLIAEEKIIETWTAIENAESSLATIISEIAKHESEVAALTSDAEEFEKIINQSNLEISTKLSNLERSLENVSQLSVDAIANLNELGPSLSAAIEEIAAEQTRTNSEFENEFGALIDVDGKSVLPDALFIEKQSEATIRAAELAESTLESFNSEYISAAETVTISVDLAVDQAVKDAWDRFTQNLEQPTLESSPQYAGTADQSSLSVGINHAALSRGGRVAATNIVSAGIHLTSPPIGNAKKSFLANIRELLLREGSASDVLLDDDLPIDGQSRYCFQGSQGHITVTLRYPVAVLEIGLFTPAIGIIDATDLSSLPSKVQFLGWRGDSSADGGTFDLGWFDEAGRETEVATSGRWSWYNVGGGQPLRAVTISVHDNHGNPHQTCIYRVSVQGERKRLGGWGDDVSALTDGALL